MAKITIVVPVYKVEEYLHRCVDSILAQTNPDFELILVDDGSPDRCGEICEAYADQDDRIIALHRENGGLSAARNTGIEYAQAHSISEWITFIDSDDWIHPRYLEALYQAAEHTGLSVVVCGFERTGEDWYLPALPDSLPAKVRETEQFYCDEKVNATVAWGKLYRRQDFSDVRYPEGKIHEDEFTTYKILFQYPQIAVVDQPLYLYYQNPQSIMGSAWNPKHIAECDGMQNQIAFFLKNGFQSAAAYTAKVFLISIHRNLSHAKKEGTRFQQEQALLKKRLRKALLNYRKLAGVSLQDDPWLYYEAFPTETIPYRAYQKLMNRISRG